MSLRRLGSASLFAAVVILAALAVSGPRAVAQDAATAVDGATIFAANCSGCHQAEGQGVPGAFPPLAGHVADFFAVEGGPSYVASVVLFGLEGPITVEGESYNGVMPSFFRMSDEEIAAVIDHVVTALGEGAQPPEGYEPLTAADVKTARNAALSPALVHDRRPQIEGEGEDGEAVELVEASYTTEQVERIRATYNRLCQECHGSDLTGGLIGGPPLAGFVFRKKWGGRSLGALYQFTATQMPQGSPGSLSPQQYADLLALILSHNGHAAGEEPLTPDLERLSGLTVRPN